MIPHVSVRSDADQVTMDDVLDCYETMRDGIVRRAEIAKRNLTDGTDLQDPKLFGKSVDELNAYFERLLDEADKQASLFIIAAAEAALRVDFWKRVDGKRGKRNDSVNRAFCRIRKSRKVRERLEEDILDTWSDAVLGAKSKVGVFKGALRFRHWLAHGRYWVWKHGAKYDPNALILIVEDLFSKTGVAGN